MANDDPVDLGVLELLDTDLTGESTVGLVVDVLGSNADLGVGQAAGEGEVQGRRRDDDLGAVVELGGVEVVHDAGDAISNTVPAHGMSMAQLDAVRTFWRGMEGFARSTSRMMEGQGLDLHLEVTTDEELARHFE